MTQQEYEQQRRECFVKFCKGNGIDQEVNISIFDAFDQIFDRAYALGREKETITQVEIESHSTKNAVEAIDAVFAANPIALNPAACAADAVHELTRALMRGSLDEFEHNAVIYCDGKRIEVYASKKPTDPDDPDQ